MSLVPLISRRLPLFLLITLGLASCHVTPYQRSLPDWIQRVYVPMAINKTYEPGLEEAVTKSIQTEITADGRLDVTQKSKADVIVQVTLVSYSEIATAFENDNIASSKQKTLKMDVKLFDPKDMKNPIGTIPPFNVMIGSNSDYRSSYSELDVDARDRLGESAGLQFVQALMTRTAMTAQ